METRPLRKDAERNRQRILAAAAAVFTERGLEVSLDEVARRAGVGVGTVYRRFPDKKSLVEALFTERIDEVAALAVQALSEPDPWLALVSYLEQVTAVMAGDLGLKQMLLFATQYGQELAPYARQRLAPLAGALIARAQATGQVRADLAPTDIPFICLMLSTSAEYAQQTRPDIWRRYLALLIDGLGATRAEITPLPVPALGPDEMETTMSQRAPRQR